MLVRALLMAPMLVATAHAGNASVTVSYRAGALVSSAPPTVKVAVLKGADTVSGPCVVSVSANVLTLRVGTGCFGQGTPPTGAEAKFEYGKPGKLLPAILELEKPGAIGWAHAKKGPPAEPPKNGTWYCQDSNGTWSKAAPAAPWTASTCQRARVEVGPIVREYVVHPSATSPLDFNIWRPHRTQELALFDDDVSGTAWVEDHTDRYTRCEIAKGRLDGKGCAAIRSLANAAPVVVQLENSALKVVLQSDPAKIPASVAPFGAPTADVPVWVGQDDVWTRRAPTAASIAFVRERYLSCADGREILGVPKPGSASGAGYTIDRDHCPDARAIAGTYHPTRKSRPATLVFERRSDLSKDDFPNRSVVTLGAGSKSCKAVVRRKVTRVELVGAGCVVLEGGTANIRVASRPFYGSLSLVVVGNAP